MFVHYTKRNKGIIPSTARTGKYLCAWEEKYSTSMNRRVKQGAASIAVGVVAFYLLRNTTTAGAVGIGVLWALATAAVIEGAAAYRHNHTPSRDEPPHDMPPSQEGGSETEGMTLAVPSKWAELKESMAAIEARIGKDADTGEVARDYLSAVQDYENLVGMYGDILPVEEQAAMLDRIKTQTARIKEHAATNTDPE